MKKIEKNLNIYTDITILTIFLIEFHEGTEEYLL